MSATVWASGDSSHWEPSRLALARSPQDSGFQHRGRVCAGLTCRVGLGQFAGGCACLTTGTSLETGRPRAAMTGVRTPASPFPPWGQGPAPGPLVARGRVASTTAVPVRPGACCGASDSSDSQARHCQIASVPLDPSEDHGHSWAPAGHKDTPRGQDLFPGVLKDPGGKSPSRESGNWVLLLVPPMPWTPLCPLICPLRALADSRLPPASAPMAAEQTLGRRQRCAHVCLWGCPPSGRVPRSPGGPTETHSQVCPSRVSGVSPAWRWC